VRFGSLAVVPLIVEGRALGAASFSFEAPRQFSVEERAFIVAIVQQAAYNLARARVFESEQRARRRVSFVARASGALSGSLDTQGTLAQLAELSVANLSDWFAVDMLNADGGLDNVVTAHVDRSKTALAEEFRRRYRPDPSAERGV